MPTVKEILDPMCPLEKKLVRDLGELAELSKKLRDSGHTVGIVGGVWDLVHVGHARYLAQAKAECDVLIGVVDSDDLVRHRKGPHRPVVPEEERIEMLHHMRWVNIITVRPLNAHSEDTEYLNKAVKPEVCILSTSTGDISEEKRRVIAQHVNRIAVFPPQAETSSSARIRRLAIDGASPLAEALSKLVGGKAEAIAQILSTLPQEMGVAIDSHMQELNRS